MKNVKHLIALFYVTLILLFKVAGLHSLSHHVDDTDVQQCEVCHITTSVSFTPLLETESPSVPQIDFYSGEPKNRSIAPFIRLTNRHLASHLFTRPPPQFI